MALDPVKNFAISRVATAPSPADSGTTLVVETGDGALFPDPSSSGEYNVVIYPNGEQPTSTNAEIVRVTARSSDTMTIDREEESTSARTIVEGDIVMLGITAKVVDDLDDIATVAAGIATEFNGGWISAGETWTYASATTITVPSGAASKYQKGDKIKITNNSATKYFYIIGVADTVLTVTGGSDYTVHNSAITNPYFSKIENPQGFPSGFNSSTANVKFRISTGGDVVLKGWGYRQSANSTTMIVAGVNFGITFATAPIVVLGSLSAKASAGAPSSIGQFVDWDGQRRNVYGITTTGFVFGVEDYATGSTNYWWGFSFSVFGQI